MTTIECNGCQRTLHLDRLKVCPDCSYRACSDCAVHACTIHKVKCIGSGECACGSCTSQLLRHLHPAKQFEWSGVKLGTASALPVVDKIVYHHNLARGTCFCQDSNFGRPYSSLVASSAPGKPVEVMCYMGAKNGRPYRPEGMCWACRDIIDSKPDSDPASSNSLKRCSKCKSAMYCSVKCQKAHWRVHKLSCVEEPSDTVNVNSEIDLDKLKLESN